VLRIVSGVFCLVLALLIVTLPSSAGSRDAEAFLPTIYVTSWGETLALDGSGLYNEVAADVLANVPGAVNYNIMPFRRAQVRFFASGNSCLYPASLPAMVKAGQIKDPENYLESAGVFNARTHLFVRAGETPPSSLADLSGKSVAYPNGSVVRGLLEGSGARLINVNDEMDKAEMLQGGRVDMITGGFPGVALVFAKLGGKTPVYDPSFSLYNVAVTFICHKTYENEKFLKVLNGAIEALAQTPEHLERMAAVNMLQNVIARASGDDAYAKTNLKAPLRPAK